MPSAMGLRLVPRRLDVAVPYVGVRDLQALSRHQAVERRRDPFRSRIEDNDHRARVGPEVGAGGDGGAGGEKNCNAEWGMRNARVGVGARDIPLRFRIPHSAFRISAYAAAYRARACALGLSPSRLEVSPSPRARAPRPRPPRGDAPPPGS